MASLCLWLLYFFLQGSVSGTQVWLCLLLLSGHYPELKKCTVAFFSWNNYNHVHICGFWHGSASMDVGAQPDIGCRRTIMQRRLDPFKNCSASVLRNGSAASLFPAKAWQSLED